MSIEAMKQALESLESLPALNWIPEKDVQVQETIAALRTAIEQAEQREWVGLTDEEIDEAIKSCKTLDTYKYFRAIEAKLKEKNQ